MKTKPFNTPYVQAILSGRKTMFREVIKPQPDGITANNKPYLKKFVDIWDTETNDIVHTDKYNGHQIVNPINHRFQINDIIAVKESWMNAPNYPLLPEKYYYKASAAKQFLEESPNEWHSPVTMPREAHRLFLEVVSVKVERLQDISEVDAVKEGVEKIGNILIWSYKDYSTKDTLYERQLTARDSFASLYPDQWQRNDWVFVYEFRRVEKP